MECNLLKLYKNKIKFKILTKDWVSSALYTIVWVPSILNKPKSISVASNQEFWLNQNPTPKTLAYTTHQLSLMDGLHHKEKVQLYFIYCND